MTPIANQYTLAKPIVAERDATEYVSLIVPGQGKLEGMTFATDAQIERAVQRILAQIGEDPAREGLLRTPGRVATMYAELTDGYHIDPEALINDAVFSVDYDKMVIVKDIDFSSLCEHHMLLFMGRIHVAPTFRMARRSACRRSHGSSRCSRGACRCRNA
jgi:GTP cyclohydrolase I